MKDIIKFLIFILYCTCIFLLPNSKVLILPLLLNLIIIFALKIELRKIIKGMLKVLPFVIFTFLINCILDEYIKAMYIGIKLLIVCNITYIYSNITTITRNS